MKHSSLSDLMKKAGEKRGINTNTGPLVLGGFVPEEKTYNYSRCERFGVYMQNNFPITYKFFSNLELYF